MKKLLLAIVFIVGCEDECEEFEIPDPPYGDNYDDYSTSETTSGELRCWNTHTYTYYCQDDRYRSITYSKTDCCANKGITFGVWDKTEDTSDCIGE